jgi:hypothetical protein
MMDTVYFNKVLIRASDLRRSGSCTRRTNGTSSLLPPEQPLTTARPLEAISLRQRTHNFVGQDKEEEGGEKRKRRTKRIQKEEREQEVLGRTNRLLSLIRHEPHLKRSVQQFFYCRVCIHYRGNVPTEPFPSNDRGIFTDQLPSNDKGIFTEPLPNNYRGDTQTHAQTQTDCNVIS